MPSLVPTDRNVFIERTEKKWNIVHPFSTFLLIQQVKFQPQRKLSCPFITKAIFTSREISTMCILPSSIGYTPKSQEETITGRQSTRNLTINGMQKRKRNRVGCIKKNKISSSHNGGYTFRRLLCHFRIFPISP